MAVLDPRDAVNEGNLPVCIWLSPRVVSAIGPNQTAELRRAGRGAASDAADPGLNKLHEAQIFRLLRIHENATSSRIQHETKRFSAIDYRADEKSSNSGR